MSRVQGEDGYWYDEDEYGNLIGFCNACGEEANQFMECDDCDDGEVVGYDNP